MAKLHGHETSLTLELENIALDFYKCSGRKNLWQQVKDNLMLQIEDISKIDWIKVGSAMSFTAANYENAIMDLLETMGYTRQYSPDITRDYHCRPAGQPVSAQPRAAQGCPRPRAL